MQNDSDRRDWDGTPLPELARCKHCGRHVIFRRTAKSGKLVPMDPEPIEGDGRRAIYTTDGVLLVGEKARGERGWEPHHGTCPVFLRFQKIRAAKKRAARAQTVR